MGFLTKAIAIFAREKTSYYYQNNDWGGNLLLIRLNQLIMSVYQKLWMW